MKTVIIIALLFFAFSFTQAQEKQQLDTIQLTKWQNDQLVELQKSIQHQQEKFNLILLTLFGSNKIEAAKVKDLKIEQGKLIILIEN
jgi:hypothetical protein